MVVATTTTSIRTEKIRHIELPIIDLKAEKSEVIKKIVKACEDFGFFKVINHGVPSDVISRMEEGGKELFAKPVCEKQQAGPANPYGYGSKNIGLMGDQGEVEYILLQTNPLSISEKIQRISTDPMKFRYAVSSYIEAVRDVACDILELISEGLGVPLDTSVLSRLIRDVDSDSVFRLNHYPPLKDISKDTSASSFHHHQNQNGTSNSDCNNNRVIGFGEHTDPQILTLLTSNGVGGLQISLEDGVWVPVNPQPLSSFCVFVGDVLEAMTNGRFPSVRHRAIVNTMEARMSMAFFASPPLHAKISPIPELLSGNKRFFKSFTWAEYKKATYANRLGERRLSFFMIQEDEESC